MSRREGAGDLALVLHSHMPYVEGFGTYPFGEEWLFDAVIRSYLPVLEVARDLTLTVTPVLADQLEDAGGAAAAARVPGAVADRRRRSRPRRGAGRVPAARSRPSWPAAERALALLDAAGGDPLAPFQRAAAEGRVALAASVGDPRRAAAAGDPRGPAAAARRRHPLAPPPLRLGRRLLAAGVRLRARARVAPGRARRALVLRRPERPRGAAGGADPGRDRGRADGAADRLGGGRLALVAGRLPLRPRPRPVRRQNPARGADLAGRRRRLRPGRRRRRGAPPGGRVPRRGSPPACASFAAERGRRGLLVFAIDTELLGHWWSEGPVWLEAVLEGAAAAGVRLVDVPTALAEHEPRAAPAARPRAGARRRTSAPGTRPRSPTSPGARGGWSCGCCGRSAAACAATARRRAARELLAAQASDWAFLDGRRQAGDYAYQRATDHAEAMLEAIDSDLDTDPRMRSLAPDLSIAPLLEP